VLWRLSLLGVGPAAVTKPDENIEENFIETVPYLFGNRFIIGEAQDLFAILSWTNTFEGYHMTVSIYRISAVALVLFAAGCSKSGLDEAPTQPQAEAKTPQEEPKQPHVVFVTGDCEYRSEVSMPMIAEILEAKHELRCSVAYAVDDTSGERDPKYRSNIEGLEALKTADLAVFFIRFRTLPQDQFELIMEYVNSGKPFIGLRTSTHSFQYPQEHELAKWNDEFGKKLFGQRWITHHGHESRTDVAVVPEQSSHPILRGVGPTFPCGSWLYHVAPLIGDCEPLLIGTSVDSNKTNELDKYPLKQPVAWTKTYDGSRVFFTTLGHPQDFEHESMRRLLINGIYWCLGRDVPQEGANADIEGEYVAPPTT